MNKEQKSLFYPISLIVLGVLFLVSIVLVVTYYQRANRTESYIDTKVSEATAKQQSEDRAFCEMEKKDIIENPWETYQAPDLLGAFTFQYPRGWSKYEIFDISSQKPLSIYFESSMVSYDTKLREIHSALEVSISKNLYAKELDLLEKEAVKAKEENEITDVKVSNFDGRKFYYKDKDLDRYVYVIIIPYRDRTLLIRSDNARDYKDYFDKFASSFVLTP